MSTQRNNLLLNQLFIIIVIILLTEIIYLSNIPLTLNDISNTMHIFFSCHMTCLKGTQL
jgi:hypothetical protein